MWEKENPHTQTQENTRCVGVDANLPKVSK